jgi:predicted dehydrogenase
MKIGVIGAGSISYPHVSAYRNNPNITEIVVAELNEGARARLCERFQIKQSTGRLDELLSDPSIDVIDNCLPSFLHQQISIDAMQAGKNVICEKPLALNIQGVDDMINVSQKTGKNLFGVLNQRFMPMHARVRALIDQGEIGQVMFMTSFICGNEIDRMNEPEHWKGDRVKSGGGVLIDSGIHHVDLMRYFLGSAKSVSATMKRVMVKPAHKEEDNAFVTIEFQNNVVGNLIASYTMTELPWTEPKTIYGTQGTIVIDDSGKTPVKLIKAARKDICDDGYTRCQETKEIPIPVDPVPVNNPNPLWYFSLKCCLDNFIDSIRTGAVPQVTLQDSRQAIAVISAAYASFRSGKRCEV